MKVLLGLSGGVDSAVAAYILKKQGHEVVCAFMRNWDAFANNDILGNPTIQNDICPQEQDYLDAKAVADKLGLELLRVDFIEEYWNDVLRLFLTNTNAAERRILIFCATNTLNSMLFTAMRKTGVYVDRYRTLCQSST